MANVFQLKETCAKILEIDYLDEKSIEKAAEAYGDKALDILINVGGKWCRYDKSLRNPG